jgi:arylsulfatase A-like enzyme
MPEAKRPNIIFILLDQMRWDCLSVAGHPVVETPNIDQLAHNGVRFTAAYSSCPSCIAARASIMTGLSPSSTGRLGYRDAVPWRYDDMLPQVLADAGYQTHCVGKTHFYPQRKHCGFQSLESYEGEQNFDGLYVNDYFEWLREKTNGRLEERDHGVDGNSWVARPSHLPEELHNNTWVATKGIEFLRRRDRTRPFFLNLSFHRPHPPIDPPQAFYDMYKNRELPPVPVGEWADVHDVPVTNVNAWHSRLSDKLLAHARRGYYAQVAHIDSQIGRMMRFISRHRDIGPTAFVFTADHGEMLGDHHMFRKTYAYEGSAAVPLIISVPGGVSGRVCDEPVVLEDLYPTIVECAGERAHDGVEALSLADLATDDEPAPLGRDYVHGEHAACYDDTEAMQFLTDGKEKYIWFTVTGREQLFDLSNDPGETRDLAAEPAAQDRLEMWRKRMVDELAGRERDGLCEGGRLISGIRLPAVRPELLE